MYDSSSVGAGLVGLSMYFEVYCANSDRRRNDGIPDPQICLRAHSVVLISSLIDKILE
jgi:hypothetical protein